MSLSLEGLENVLLDNRDAFKGMCPQMYRTDFWTLWEKERVGCFERTCILSRVKQITSPGWMRETSTRIWCTGKTQRDGLGWEAGGGIRMGNTCKSMADSCQCMTKATTILLK